jgi:Icc-related predicted phosphoesterase
MRIVHISDTHNKHPEIHVPECDVVCFTGDMGGRTNLHELTQFLIWFEKLPAKVKIFIAGNHDIVMDKKWVQRKKNEGYLEGMLANQAWHDARQLIENYNVKYLEETDYVYEGIKFFGSPYSPSFHRQNWVFNADRGQEIKTIWGRIPNDVDVLLTHSPVFGVLDEVPVEGRTDWHIDGHVGCQDLLDVIKKRLTNLKLHCFGHIHDNVGIVIKSVSKSRRVIFSNGACVTNSYTPILTKPFIIEL